MRRIGLPGSADPLLGGCFRQFQRAEPHPRRPCRPRLLLLLVREKLSTERLPIRPLALLTLGLLFLKELALSAWAVLKTVVRRDMALKPGIFAYETGLTRDMEVTLLANLITLTPGTLSVDIRDDGRDGRRILYVHALDCADPAGLRRGIADGFERRIREAFA